MRSVAEHLAACLDIAQAAAPLDVVLLDAVGCVLAEDVVAQLDLPVVDMDGYAVAVDDLAGVFPGRPVRLDVVDDVRAGDVRPIHLVRGSAVIIDSGAPMPQGADAVVPWTATDRGTSRVEVRARVESGANVRRRGEDVTAGTTVLPKGSRISARQIALLAGLGRHRVNVHPAPRVVIISIGNELVEPGRPRETGQVFDANGHALACAVTDAGGRAFRVAAVPDELGALRETIEDQLVRADVLITTGGAAPDRGLVRAAPLLPARHRLGGLALPGRQARVRAGAPDRLPHEGLPRLARGGARDHPAARSGAGQRHRRRPRGHAHGRGRGQAPLPAAGCLRRWRAGGGGAWGGWWPRRAASPGRRR